MNLIPALEVARVGGSVTRAIEACGKEVVLGAAEAGLIEIADHSSNSDWIGRPAHGRYVNAAWAVNEASAHQQAHDLYLRGTAYGYEVWTAGQ